jgi:hypothetical protein
VVGEMLLHDQLTGARQPSRTQSQSGHPWLCAGRHPDRPAQQRVPVDPDTDITASGSRWVAYARSNDSPRLRYASVAPTYTATPIAMTSTTAANCHR